MFKRKSAPFRFKSPAQAWVNGGVLDFTKFVELRGPRGGRVVIDSIILHASLSLTVAVATTQGEDLYRAFDKVTIEEIDGTRRLNEVGGDALRVISFAHNGEGRTHEHADVAAGTSTVTFTCEIPLTKPFAYDPGDYAMPAEMLQKVSIGCATSSRMGLGTSTVTINSGTYWVIAECHEEFGVVQYLSDEWIVRPMASSSATEHTLSFSKGRPQDLYFWVPGQDGGQSLANLDEILIVNLMPKSLKKDPDLRTFFERERGQAPNALGTTGAAYSTSPFSGSTLRAVAALLCAGTKSFEGPERTEIDVKLTETAALPAAPYIIARVVYPRSERVEAGLAGRYGRRSAYVKTRDNSKRALSDWKPEYRRYLPLKFV